MKTKLIFAMLFLACLTPGKTLYAQDTEVEKPPNEVMVLDSNHLESDSVPVASMQVKDEGSIAGVTSSEYAIYEVDNSRKVAKSPSETSNEQSMYADVNRQRYLKGPYWTTKSKYGFGYYNKKLIKI